MAIPKKIYPGTGLIHIDYSVFDWDEKKIFYFKGQEYCLNFEELYNQSMPIFRNLMAGSFRKYISEYDDLCQVFGRVCMYFFVVASNPKSQIFALIKMHTRRAMWRYVERKVLCYSLKIGLSLDEEVGENKDTTLANLIPSYDKYNLIKIDTSVFTPELIVYKMLLIEYSADDIFDNDKERIALMSEVRTKVCEQLNKDPRPAWCFKFGCTTSIRAYFRAKERNLIKENRKRRNKAVS
jgi:hypothetical protein